MKEAPRLSLRGLSKSFGATAALSDVSFDVAQGERLAVLGENGAGKSTLMKVLVGAYKADHGNIELDGESFLPDSPAAAMAAGVSIVYQEPSFFQHLSVLENVFVGRELVTRTGDLAWGRMRDEARRAFEELDLDPGLLSRPMGSLSLAEQQMALIARAVHVKCRILILDEPTSILTANEAARLFTIVDRLAAKNVTVLYITHRFDELPRVADRVVILKDGALVGDLAAAEADHETIIRLMSGRTIAGVVARKHGGAGDELIRIRGLSQMGNYRQVDLDVAAGEIVGLYGLVGSGRTELALTIFGDTQADSGTMTLKGKQYAPKAPQEAIRRGVAYLPEDRKTQGIFPDMTTGDNIVASMLRRSSNVMGVLDLRRLATIVTQGIQSLRIKAPSPSFPVTGLSGGHQQKVLYARWLVTEPDLLILDEPTRGIDVGTKAEIHTRILELADQGIGVLLISSELPELLAISDRIVVMRSGQVKANLVGSERNEDAILRATLGVESGGSAA